MRELRISFSPCTVPDSLLRRMADPSFRSIPYIQDTTVSIPRVVRLFLRCRFEALSLPLVLRALHTYHIADYSRGVLAGDVNWGKALDGATSAVATLCTRLLGAWGGSAIVRGINQIRSVVHRVYDT